MNLRLADLATEEGVTLIRRRTQKTGTIAESVLTKDTALELQAYISAAGVTKAFALAAHCAELGIRPEEVVAFGDMPNDVPMLTWAGRGVAVANAHPEALAAADEVTASNDEDGVALVLEQL